MTNQSTPISKLKNIGPKSAALLLEIDITTESDLRQRGVIHAYQQLKAQNPHTVNLMMLWALQGALLDINCLYLPQEIKDVLKEELSAAPPPSTEPQDFRS